MVGPFLETLQKAQRKPAVQPRHSALGPQLQTKEPTIALCLFAVKLAEATNLKKDAIPGVAPGGPLVLVPETRRHVRGLVKGLNAAFFIQGKEFLQISIFFKQSARQALGVGVLEMPQIRSEGLPESLNRLFTEDV